jgi:hypothetical protein
MPGFETPEAVGEFDLEHNGPRGIAWTEDSYDDPVDLGRVRTVTVFRPSPAFDYSVRVRRGGTDLDPFRRPSREIHSTHGERDEAIDEAVRLMRDLSGGT